MNLLPLSPPPFFIHLLTCLAMVWTEKKIKRHMEIQANISISIFAEEFLRFTQIRFGKVSLYLG